MCDLRASRQVTHFPDDRNSEVGSMEFGMLIPPKIRSKQYGTR